MTTRVVAAPYVFVGAAGPEGAAAWLADGAVALDGDVVVEAGPRAEVEARHGAAERLDAALLPALVNAHTHLELSYLSRRIPGGAGLADWVRMLVAARADRPERWPDATAALNEAVLELEEAGVAAVGDVTNGLGSLPALRRAGIAGTIFLEVFGFAPDRIDGALARACAAWKTAGDPGPGLRIALSPHAVYSTHPATLARLLAAGPASIHLAEDPAERAFAARAEGPFAQLNRMLGASFAPFARSAVAAVAPSLRRDSLAVHCVDVDDEDVALLAGSGATVVLCPRSNLHIGGALPDLPRLLAAGLPLAVGTDSLASSPSLSPLAELSTLARAFPSVAAARLLPLAWNGAAVGAPGVGSLAPGSAPGVLAAPLDGARPHDPARWLVREFGPSERPFRWIARHRPGGPAAQGPGSAPATGALA
jgi:cytosine/adenosine deaminase-related metal-dependent hydrolase